MTARAQQRLRKLERLALLVGGGAFVVAALLGWRAPAGIPAAWRLAVFIALQPALGSLIFVLIHRLTGGQWMEGLAPFLAAGTRLLPWIWLLALPLLWWPVAGGQEPREDASAALARAFASEPSRHADAALRRYFSQPLLAARALVYAVGFFLLGAGARRALRGAAPDTLRWLGPVGLIALVFLLHLLATDWLVLLEPGWYSTGFALVWMVAQAVAGLAAATAAAVLFGAEPAVFGSSRRPRGLDWGNLLLAALMSWTYVAFVQWLIIWSGNLPAETAWYRHRAHGGWTVWLIALALLNFAAPFALLLSRGVKRSGAALGATAALLVVGQAAYTVWIIAPAVAPRGIAGQSLIGCAALAAGALFLNRYLAAARRAAVALAV